MSRSRERKVIFFRRRRRRREVACGNDERVGNTNQKWNAWNINTNEVAVLSWSKHSVGRKREI